VAPVAPTSPESPSGPVGPVAPTVPEDSTNSKASPSSFPLRNFRDSMAAGVSVKAEKEVGVTDVDIVTGEPLPSTTVMLFVTFSTTTFFVINLTSV
jgi:hypothetical protein